MQTENQEKEFRALTVTSTAFKTGEPIPRKYTCIGEDINPPLDIKSFTPETKSLALIIDDPDAPKGTWLHWTVWNIPVTHHIREDIIPGQQGHNDFGRNTYGGPCPLPVHTAIFLKCMRWIVSWIYRRVLHSGIWSRRCVLIFLLMES